jgi:hypothetical protein
MSGGGQAGCLACVALVRCAQLEKKFACWPVVLAAMLP